MKPTPWAETEKKLRKERVKDMKQAGRKPAGIRRIHYLRVTEIAIPDWGYLHQVPELSTDSGDWVWLDTKQIAYLLFRMDQDCGGKPEMFSVEARRCRVCGMLRLGLLAEQRRKLDESAFDGRKLVCGDECMTRRKQRKGEL